MASNPEVQIDVDQAIRSYRRLSSVLRSRPMRPDTVARYEGQLRAIELSLLLGDKMLLAGRLHDEARVLDGIADARRAGESQDQLRVSLRRKRALLASVR